MLFPQHHSICTCVYVCVCLCSPDWSRTQLSIDWAGLELTEIHYSSSQLPVMEAGSALQAAASLTQQSDRYQIPQEALIPEYPL